MNRRLESIDRLRGLVMALMALDHVRDYFFEQGHPSPLDLATTTPALFFTRWITHFCAPTFVFLAGVSGYLQRSRGKSPSFLFKRGLWLVVLELTVVGFGWQLWAPGAIVLQVMWAIGVSMMALSALALLPPNAVLAVGLAIVALHNTTDGVTSTNPIWIVLHAGGKLDTQPLPIYVAYPVLPWIGLMACGYGFGRVFLLEERARHRWLVGAGLVLSVGFLLMRGLDRYGDPGHWYVQSAAWKTAGDFVDVEKYPPSLQYALMTVGPALLLLRAFEHLRGPVATFLLPFGRVPMFFYVLHIYLIHALCLVLGAITGFPLRGLVNPLFAAPSDLAGWGLALAPMYGVWLLILALLVAPARWFAGVKSSRRDWWLSYL